MRVRLLGIVLSLVTLLVVGLGVPLALSVAGSEQQLLFLDRLTDASRYASLAQQPLIDQPRAAPDELRSYAELYGIDSVVVDRDARPVASSASDGVSSPVDLADPAIATAIRDALAGRHSEPASLLLPWDTDPLLVAEPVLVDGEIRGAVLTVSPTGNARERVLVRWVVIALGGMLALGLAVLVALPVVRWILRPVRRLDDATEALVAAVVSGKDFERVADGHGPAELRHLTRSFDQMAASVGDALAAQRAFVANASHQLRNPLTALRLRLDNLGDHLDPGGAEHFSAAVKETERLKEILDDLLSMARAEGSGSEPVVTEVDPPVADRVADWRVVAESRGIQLEVVGNQEITRVLTPPKAIETIVDALLDNALKFSDSMSMVRVELGRRGELATLAVRDHGPGLPEEDLERATERFWRSRTHQNVTGSGLGLAIVRRIAERAGGGIRLALPEGGGLLVTVELPLAEGS
jgi:signal transduction histidine kinase